MHSHNLSDEILDANLCGKILSRLLVEDKDIK